MLVALREHLETVRRLLAGEPLPAATPRPSALLEAGAAVRALCDEMEALMPALTGLGIDLPGPAGRSSAGLATR